MIIPVFYLSYKDEVPAHGYWDHGVIDAIIKQTLWRPVNGFEFTEIVHPAFHFIDEVKSLRNRADMPNGAVIVFPARAQFDCIDKLNQDIETLDWLVLILTGDEEGVFPFERIKHPNMSVWVMSPHPERHGEAVRRLGTGFPQHAQKMIKSLGFKGRRNLEWFFAGQITHQRRQLCAQKLREIQETGRLKGELIETDGFTKGIKPREYYAKMLDAKVAPCPTGPFTPDSFRLFEALECGTIPIADTEVPAGNYPHSYWSYFFGAEPPFPVITDYEQLPGYINDQIKQYPKKANRVFAWWQAHKRKMAYWLQEDITRLSGLDASDHQTRNLITVLMPTSPSPYHPDESITVQTIDEVRRHLPDNEIILMFDGVRKEQENRRQNYEDYIQRMLWHCNTRWRNVLPIVFDKHTHQASMTRKVIDEQIKTPLLLFVEHDAPLVPDYEIEWKQLSEAIIDGQAHMIRFYHEAIILPEHHHLMIGEPEMVDGIRMQRTAQWSQRPHLASVAWYRECLNNYFHPESRTMIEDVMHGVVVSRVSDLMSWYQFRIWIYAPDGNNIKRSYHLDARGADPKYEMTIKEVTPQR